MHGGSRREADERIDQAHEHPVAQALAETLRRAVVHAFQHAVPAVADVALEAARDPTYGTARQAPFTPLRTVLVM